MTAKNSVFGEEVQADREGESFATPISQTEKWSSKASAARSLARSWRMEKLKMAGILREKPDFEFLVECWNDDPALQIAIKKLLAKFHRGVSRV